MTTILVIEDEEPIRANIIELLEAEDFQVLGADSGVQGLALAQTYLPDLILCDIMIPELDGYEVLQQLRQNSATATIPLIFLTALSDQRDTRRGMELGADDYLTKPCTPDALLRAIASRLTRKALFEQQTAAKLNELRTNINHSLPHELRTPLNTILGFAELLMADLEELPVSEIQEIVEQIHRSGLLLYRLIQNFLLYAELELISIQPEQIASLQNSRTEQTEIYLEEIATQEAKKAGREGDLQLEIIASSAQVSVNHFKIILTEIINNAFKFSEAQTSVQVKSQREEQFLTITVSNYGRGLTVEQIQSIGGYMQFERKLYEQSGSGLGLAIAQRLVELYGGSFSVESIPEQITTLRILLPV
ncbi:hybrid sensor histidine kinase/response regulator [Spirulina subsalsa]|uniref:hybrid sensor histidine kinase/response regulator n=1 Tax=Spirulina subsalsa TaxID=54311 RepID=UPI000316C8AE|nr:hybrid sensor histidine kinase/response regulator [Spirulina subsalsa]